MADAPVITDGAFDSQNLAFWDAHSGQYRAYWRYFTSKQARQDYEIEAYRVWVQVEPADMWRCVRALTGSYGLDITDQDAMELLK